MYRLVLYGLTALAALAVILGFVGVLAYGAAGMLISLWLLIAVCWGTNKLFAQVLGAPRNIESEYITAFILFFLLAPVASPSDAGWIVAAGVIAMASKYIFAIKKRHIFNPAAVAAVTVGLLGSTVSIWWVGTPVMLPFVAIFGLLVVRKIRRFDLFWSFVLSSVVATIVYDLYIGVAVQSALLQTFLSWPLVFFATIMLTEPLTTPPAQRMRIAYGVLTGILFAVPFHLGILYASPALALVLGNIFSYLVSPKQRIVLRFVSKQKLSANVYEFAFAPNAQLTFAPGQYMEWTLPHRKSDTRGNRRYFTIASAPGDEHIKLGVRISPEPSSFKKALMHLERDAVLSAASLAGEFTLPADASQKLVFIAGGVGITPFASMLRDLIARAHKRDIVLIYAASTEEDFAYRDVLDAAKAAVGLKVVYVPKVLISDELIKKEVPDYKTRMFYLSGPNAMVRTYRTLLLTLGVHRLKIKTDYFPGF